jgi:hypothetical protein
MKVRTLNELRQEKEFGYKQPTKKIVINSEPNLDSKEVIKLIKQYPNDYELGGALRKYYLNKK